VDWIIVDWYLELYFVQFRNVFTKEWIMMEIRFV